MALVALGPILGAGRPPNLVGMGPVLMDPELAHANGLVAAAPDGFDVQATTDGFVLAETGGLRTPREIRLALTPSPPRVAGPRGRAINGRWVPFAVREVGGGSGGTTYELVAIRPMETGYLVMTATVQTETSPRFDAAWATLERAGVEARDGHPKQAGTALAPVTATCPEHGRTPALHRPQTVVSVRL